MTRDKLNGAAYDLSLFEPQKKVGSTKATETKQKKDKKMGGTCQSENMTKE